MLSETNLPELRQEDQIGSGTFGVVYRIQYKQKLYAIKRLQLKNIHRCRMTAQVQRQIKIMQKLNCPNIVKCYDSFSDSKKQYKYLVLQLCDCNLLQYMNQHKQLFQQDSSIKIKICLEIINALSYMKRNRVANRDIKIQNIMIKKLGTQVDDIMIKITDFGEAREYINAASTRWRVGSYKYMSPQVFMGKMYDDSCDLWSAGVVFYQIFQGFDPNIQNTSLLWPFMGQQPKYQNQIQQEQYNEKYYNHYIKQPLVLSTKIPNVFRKIIRGLLKFQPSLRLKIIDIADIIKSHEEQLSKYLENDWPKYTDMVSIWKKQHEELLLQVKNQEKVKNEITEISQKILKRMKNQFVRLKEAYRMSDVQFVQDTKFKDATTFFCKAFQMLVSKIQQLQQRFGWSKQDFQKLISEDQMQDFQKIYNRFSSSLIKINGMNNFAFDAQRFRVKFLKAYMSLYQRQFCQIAATYFNEFNR